MQLSRTWIGLWIGLLALTAALAVAGSALAQADDAESCPPVDLGELTDLLSTSGAWLADDECDQSQFRDNRPGRRFSFSLAEDAVVRIDLISPERDTLLYLLDDGGALVDSDDDTGGGNNSRIERQLDAGAYRIEASTVGWAGRETGSFDLTARIVQGCHDVVDLGLLEETLSADGVWSHFGCESAFRADRSSQRYRFQLADITRVQIDLTSAAADSYLYLLDEAGVLLESDDDGGVRFDSRIVRVLGAGEYTIETTNWGDRDLKNLQEAAYELTVAYAEAGPSIKLEAIEAPDTVVLGAPFDIHYRVGNLGDAPLSSIDGSVRIRVRWPYISNWRTGVIGVDDGDEGSELWQVGSSYHTSDSLAAFDSQSLEQLTSFEGSFEWRYGPTDVMLEVLTLDEEGDRVDRHWLTRPIMVFSGIHFGETAVSVDGVEYRVVAIAGEDGEVTTEVAAAASETEADTDDPDAEAPELPDDVQLKAIYAAGVQTQMLHDLAALSGRLQAATDSLFSSVSRGGLPLSDVSAPLAPTADALRASLTAAHQELLGQAGFDSSRFHSAVDAEALVLRAGRAAALRIERYIDQWNGLDGVISAEDALATHAEVSIAVEVDARLVEAAELVLTRRAADQGWDDPVVAAALREYRRGIDCRSDASALPFADAALRRLSPVYAAMLDRAVCGASAAAQDHELLLQGLGLSMNPVIPQPEVERTSAAPPTLSVAWVLARAHGDGRIEFAAELSDGEQALPAGRMFPANAAPDRWLRTGPVTSGETELGRIYVRRLSSGAVQAAFVVAGGNVERATRWSLPQDIESGVWLYSGAVEGAPAGPTGGPAQPAVVSPAGTAQFGDHLSFLSFIESNLQRNP